MTRDEVSAVLEDALGWAKDRSLRDMGKVFKAASVVNALYTERDSLLTVRETLRRECEALKDERDALLQKQWASVREISSLKAENERLRAAMERLIEAADDNDAARYGTLLTVFVREIAHAALNATTGEGHE